MDRPGSSSLPVPREVVPVAEYVRMSTEHQQYSTQNQQKVIRDYALRRGMSVVRTYIDAGKSGLRLDGRDALKQLIHDVETGQANFQAILVYDVSRWGRFQDADESAYYEYVCRRAKIAVHYCAEQFENDGSPVSTIVKGVKRAMAGEFSRELSAKVFSGQCHLIELGYRQGSSPGFGLRRMLRGADGREKGQLKRGEHKSIQTDRVILVPGPPDEVETVQGMYRAFVEEGKSEGEIARSLNARRITTGWGAPWTRVAVHRVLTNEKYIGNNVYNRVSSKLGKRPVVNPKEMWIRRNTAFEPIVSQELYFKAQAIIAEQARKLTDLELLDQLRHLMERKGKLSGPLIDESEELPSSIVYRSRFGSLIRAYRLVGYTPGHDYQFLETNKQLRLMHAAIVQDMVERIRQFGGSVTRDLLTDLLTVNEEFTASLVIARCRCTTAGSYRWLIRLDSGLGPDITVAVRMDADNRAALDYYLLPTVDMTVEKLLLAEYNDFGLDTYRFATLDFFVGMARRTPIQEPA